MPSPTTTGHSDRRFSPAAFALALLAALCLPGCTGLPAGVEPVKDFELERYLGRWYEIARLDHPFERGLEQVTADYSLAADGSVNVLNRGLDPEAGWQSAEGRARFAGEAEIGHLEVSFFGPFYASYVVFELDSQGYQYAFVCGYDRSYLWLLSRTPVVSRELKDHFVQRVAELGFAADELIFVDQGGDGAR